MNTKTYSTSFLPPLQHALFQAAKVGHVKLMQELIQEGANPFATDENGCDIVFYLQFHYQDNTSSVVSELTSTNKQEGKYAA